MNTSTRQIFTADARFELKPTATARGLATLTGYPIVWNALSSDRGGYYVRVKQGAPRFATPTAALFNHSRDMPLGSTANGTLRLFSDSKGVRVEIDVPNTAAGRDTYTLVRDRYVSGMSFAWENPQGANVNENGLAIFEAASFDVDEVSIVGNPAFKASTISASPTPATKYSERTRQRLQLERMRFAMLNLEPNPHGLAR